MLTASAVPPSVNNSLLNYPSNYPALSGLVSRLEARKRVYSKIATTTPKLPLKKRAIVHENFDTPINLITKKEVPQESDDMAAMDFSLPTRTRAGQNGRLEDDLNSCGGSSKPSPPSSCSDSPDSAIYLGIKCSTATSSTASITPKTEAVSPAGTTPRPICLPNYPTPVNPFHPFDPAAFLTQPSTSGYPIGCLPSTGASVEQLSILRGLSAIVAALNKPQILTDIEQDEEDYLEHPEHFIINPATGNKVRRNYKNMTRERRMEANARERTRVHTIGETFDRLRKLIPCLGADQKLSKLSILKISSKYIQLMGALMGRDYSEEQNGITVQECVKQLNDAINAEAKGRR